MPRSAEDVDLSGEERAEPQINVDRNSDETVTITVVNGAVRHVFQVATSPLVAVEPATRGNDR
jgi:hypothetical protein